MNAHQRRITKRETDRFTASPTGKAVIASIDNLQNFCDDVLRGQLRETDFSSVVSNRNNTLPLVLGAAYGKRPVEPRVMTPDRVLEEFRSK